MQKKYRIAVLGIGGVGGFLGGKLAAAYNKDEDIEVIFIARGDHALAIKENGLRLITPTGEMIVMPDRVADVSEDIGAIDLLLCCTKAYDLESSIKAIASSITANTIILPLLNGVDNTEKVQAVVPAAKVLHGCIYLVSKIIAPGVVQQRGEFYALHFGGDKQNNAEMAKLLDVLKQADINAILEDNIEGKVWSKFAFISPIATYTSAHNISIGKILESDEHTASLKTLMVELLALAGTMRVDLPTDTVEKNFGVMQKLPYDTTSSMHADFANNKSTELESLTGYVVKKAKEKGLHVNAYADTYQLLRKESK